MHPRGSTALLKNCFTLYKQLGILWWNAWHSMVECLAFYGGMLGILWWNAWHSLSIYIYHVQAIQFSFVSRWSVFQNPATYVPTYCIIVVFLLRQPQSCH